MLHVGRNIISLIISRVGAGVILFLIYTRLIQYLGPEVAGQYGLIASYLTIFSFFVDLGMQQLVIKKVSEDKTHAGKYLANYFGIQFLLGLMFMLIMDGFVFFADYPSDVKLALYITSVGLLLASLTMPFMAIINGYQKLSLIAKVNFVNSMINAGMMVAAIFFRRNIVFLAFISGTIALFDILVYGYLVNKKFTKFEFNFDLKFCKQLLAWNLPFMLLTIFSIYNRIDALILPHIRNFTENGYYTAVYKFWDTLAFLPAIISASLYPFFSEQMLLGQKQAARNILEIYTRYMIALAIPLVIGAYILADKITVALFGNEFAPAAPALWLLVAAVSTLFIYSPVNSLIISQLTKTATKITGFTLVFNVLLNFILIPKYGFVAAAAITWGSELIQLVGYTYFVKKQVLQFNFFRNFAKPVIAGIAMGGVLMFIKNYNLWLLILLGIAVYGVVLLIVKFFRQEDWELFKNSVNFRKKIEPDLPPTANL